MFLFASLLCRPAAAPQVLSLRRNELQWLPPDAAKMKCIQQLHVTGLPARPSH
jgi:hypothetical protein